MFKKFDPKKWERIRAKGRIRYVLLYGVLMMGSVFAVAAFLAEPLIGRIFYGQGYSSDMTLRLIQWPIAGVFFGKLIGIMTWYGGEREYENYLRAERKRTKSGRKKDKRRQKQQQEN